MNQFSYINVILDKKFVENVKETIYDNLSTSAIRYNEILKDVEIVSRMSVKYFQNNEQQKMLKIVLFSHQDKKKVINALLKSYKNLSFYNTEISYISQFMVDNNVKGCCWIKLRPDSYKIRTNEWKKTSTCQIECDVHVLSLIIYDPDSGESNSFSNDEKLSVAFDSIVPFRILSYDIECLNGPNGEFPLPDMNEVIYIGN
ncbi:DNA polymerase delta catalytic subunit-like protein, partial [Dinothrombium tinctorium]